MAKQKAVTDQNGKKRNTMYYKQDGDRELMRDSDMGGEDPSDPMETDGYGEEQEEGGWMDEPMFSVPTDASQKDDLGSPGPKMPSLNPQSKDLMVKLRKKGMPKA